MNCPKCGAALKLALDEIDKAERGMLAVYPFPIVKAHPSGEPINPPRKYSTIRPVEPNRAAEAA